MAVSEEVGRTTQAFLEIIDNADMDEFEKERRRSLLLKCVDSTNGRTPEEKIQDMTECLHGITCLSVKDKDDMLKFRERVESNQHELKKAIDETRDESRTADSAMEEEIKDFRTETQKSFEHVTAAMATLSTQVTQTNQQLTETQKAIGELKEQTAFQKGLRATDEHNDKVETERLQAKLSFWQSIFTNGKSLTFGAIVSGLLVWGILHSDRLLSLLTAIIEKF